MFLLRRLFLEEGIEVHRSCVDVQYHLFHGSIEV